MSLASISILRHFPDSARRNQNRRVRPVVPTGNSAPSARVRCKRVLLANRRFMSLRIRFNSSDNASHHRGRPASFASASSRRSVYRLWRWPSISRQHSSYSQIRVCLSRDDFIMFSLFHNVSAAKATVLGESCPILQDEHLAWSALRYFVKA